MSANQKSASDADAGAFPAAAGCKLFAVRDAQSMEPRDFFNVLISHYWKPVFYYLRRSGCGDEELEGRVEGFFSFSIEQNLFAKVDPDPGASSPSYLWHSRSHSISPATNGFRKKCHGRAEFERRACSNGKKRQMRTRDIQNFISKIFGNRRREASPLLVGEVREKPTPGEKNDFQAPLDPQSIEAVEAKVLAEWRVGDVILDLYEVRKVIEGFGNYAEEKDYHEGGFGRVYKVWHRAWRRKMAVKTPRAGVFTSQEQKDAFTRECETWVKLGMHAHIAACHYVRELGGVPRIFSEYADAGTLEERIRSRRLYEGDRQVGLERIMDTAIQFAWGQHYAHERRVIHQNVKPLIALMWKDGTLRASSRPGMGQI